MDHNSTTVNAEWRATFVDCEAEARKRLRWLRRQGESDPVLLFFAGDAMPLKATLVGLKRGDRLPAPRGLLMVIPSARAEELLSRHLSRALAVAVLHLPFEPSNAFRLVSVHPGRVEWQVISIEGEEIEQVDGASFDLKERVARLAGADGAAIQTHFEW